MRELKFRAWDGEQMLLFPEGMYGAEWDTALSCGYELMQYTGLKDKNGKEIYEGDIVEYDIFSDGVFEERVKEVIKIEFYDFEPHGGSMCWTTYKNIEVLGNIYENPGLLGESG